MGARASQITSLTIIYSTIHSDANQRKYQSSASLAFVRGIHRWPVNIAAQMASNAENFSIWWLHHDKIGFIANYRHIGNHMDPIFLTEILIDWSIEV